MDVHGFALSPLAMTLLFSDHCNNIIICTACMQLYSSIDTLQSLWLVKHNQLIIINTALCLPLKIAIPAVNDFNGDTLQCFLT